VRTLLLVGGLLLLVASGTLLVVASATILSLEHRWLSGRRPSVVGWLFYEHLDPSNYEAAVRPQVRRANVHAGIAGLLVILAIVALAAA